MLQEFGSISSPITKLNDQPLIHFLTARLTRLFSIINKSITTSATSGAETAYPSGAPEFTPGFSGVRFPQSLVFPVVFGKSLFVLCPFSVGHAIVCPSSTYGF